MAMRELCRELVKAFADVFPCRSPVVEIGSLQVPGQVGFADLRPFFPGRTYIGCDMRTGPGVDRVEDVHRLTLPDGYAGTILCVDTLEHVANPMQAMSEMRRVLAPDGALLLISVFDFPIHDHPSDYWRFTPAAFRLLLEGFTVALVGYQGDPLKPHTVVGVAARSDQHRPLLARWMAVTPQTTWLSPPGDPADGPARQGDPPR